MFEPYTLGSFVDLGGCGCGRPPEWHRPQPCPPPQPPCSCWNNPGWWQPPCPPPQSWQPCQPNCGCMNIAIPFSLIYFAAGMAASRFCNRDC